MRLIKITTLLAGLMLGGGIAAANAGTYPYTGYGFSGSNVHVSDTSLGISNEYGGAGLITLHGASYVAAYCVDIADWLLQSGTYNLGVNPATNPNLAGISSITGHTKIADIGALIFNGTNVAAVQLAIWETEYGSTATFTPDDTSLQQVANIYLDNANTIWKVPSNFALFELTPAAGQTNQTLVYLIDPPAPMPEPGTLALLSGGVFLTGMLARRRRHVAAATGA